MAYTNEHAFRVASAKTVEDLNDLCDGDTHEVTVLRMYIDIFNWVPADSGFDLIDRVKRKGA